MAINWNNDNGAKVLYGIRLAAEALVAEYAETEDRELADLFDELADALGGHHVCLELTEDRLGRDIVDLYPFSKNPFIGRV